MTKRSIIRCILSILLIIYLGVALSYTSKAWGTDNFRKVHIHVSDSEANGFITPEDIDHELGSISVRLVHESHNKVNTLNIKKRLLAWDKIEDANCTVLNNGELLIDVVPLVPVARVFEDGASTYYINRAGKRMDAAAELRIDVPVITGVFPSSHDPVYLLPVLDYINNDEELSSFVSAIEFNRNKDIIIIPSMRGHVINFGDTLNIADKFKRLKIFYNRVIPVKGWETYDTLSVKWNGQIVASLRNSRPPANQLTIEEFTDIDDVSTMSTEADGQQTETF